MNNIILQQISSTELVAEIKESILKELKEVLGMASANSNKKRNFYQIKMFVNIFIFINLPSIVG